MAGGAKKVGDWNGALNAVRSIKKDMDLAQKKSLMRFGLKAEKIAVNHIRSQDLGWAPLSEDYLDTKRKEGKSEKIYVLTSTYFQSITSWVQDDKAFAGVKRNVVHTDKEGETRVWKIAQMLEYGTEKMPARPLWQPTFKEALAWWKANALPTMFLDKKYKPI